VSSAYPIQTHVVDVTNWQRHEEFGVFPVGSKPKMLLICPSAPLESSLIPSHFYLFKIGAGRFQQQAWSEVIACRIGTLLGLPVPRCFIAADERTGEVGALVEFFYGYPHEQLPARFTPASDFMTRILVDKKHGRPHRLPTNLLVSRTLCDEAVAQEWWAKALVFDTIIGNTDRHPDNWGFLFRRGQNGRAQISLAPFFDNGTSLGYEIAEEKVAVARQSERVQAYISRGTHHCGWQKDGPCGHFELCREFTRAVPDMAQLMREVLHFDMSEIQLILDECTACEVGIKFSRERAAMVFSLINARKSTLSSLLEG
jgi:hypothetical protein